MKKKKGFTLIEMVAVIMIIGILGAILVPKINGYIKEANKVKVIEQARQVTQAVTLSKEKGNVIDESKKLSEITRSQESFTFDLLEAEASATKLSDLVVQGGRLANLKDDMKLSECRQIANNEVEVLVDYRGKLISIKNN